MNLTELDEWQGVTPAMVREWLRNRGWSLHGEIWERGRHNFADHLIDGNSDDVAFVIHCEEIAAGLTRQEALRQINPRMRKGRPSQAAITAHGGTWMAAPPMGRNGIVFVNLRVLLDPSWAEWSFWPCDANGNKVRWPTDAEGNML